jgi:hypothetical protein
MTVPVPAHDGGLDVSEVAVVGTPAGDREVGAETYDALAIPTEGDERERLWPIVKAAYPFFADHEAATERVIPVVAISRATAGATVRLAAASPPTRPPWCRDGEAAVAALPRW